MAYKPDKTARLFGIIGVAIMIATPIIYLIYRIMFYA
jgi:hypothetical protein